MSSATKVPARMMVAEIPNSCPEDGRVWQLFDGEHVARAAPAQALETKHAEVLSAEIRQDREALARYVSEQGDPAPELREMFAPSDAA